MKVGIIGSGAVARALAAGLLDQGHQVKISSRNADAAALEKWRNEAGPQASLGSFAQAAEFGEIVFVATKGTATDKALELASPGSLSGKVVVDVTNPLTMNADKQLTLKQLPDGSLGETVQRLLPTSRVVKAFNTVTAPHMYKPQFPSGTPQMFYCGNDAGGKAVVAEILAAFGWKPVDIGKIDGARLLEPMAMLGIRMAMTSGKWDYVFRVEYQDTKA